MNLQQQQQLKMYDFDCKTPSPEYWLKTNFISAKASIHMKFRGWKSVKIVKCISRAVCVFIVPTRNDCERFNTFLISLYIFVVEKFDWLRLTLKKPNQKVSRCENSNQACVCRCHHHRSRCLCCCCWQAQNSQHVYIVLGLLIPSLCGFEVV